MEHGHGEKLSISMSAGHAAALRRFARLEGVTISRAVQLLIETNPVTKSMLPSSAEATTA
jgi:hypothetical protein